MLEKCPKIGVRSYASDNIYNPKRLMAFQKSILHLGIPVPGCFFSL